MKRRAVPIFIRMGTALFLCLLLSACVPPPARHVDRSFYYWRSVFRLSPAEQRLLDSLQVTSLYIKFFDIDWNEETRRPVPVAPIRFETRPPAGLHITPVVFLTNETLLRCTPEQTDTLAQKLTSLVAQLADSLPCRELQLDCDWTAATREKYFRLLRAVRSQPFAAGKQLSATIRLHQLKFRSLSGVPPVDRGLLMCYNMGNLRRPDTRNSILDAAELKKYTGTLDTYPLPLDVALPVFDWYVWFHGNEYKGLVHSFQLPQLHHQTIHFDQDRSIGSFSFTAGDWLRYEGSDAAELLHAADMVRRQLPAGDLHVILYHLDEAQLQPYAAYQLDAVYNRFR